MEFRDLVPMFLRYRLMELRGRSIYSDYADQYQAIFIHIPKTAGTSVAKALFDRGSKHVTYHRYEETNPRKFRRYYKFAFVRNPWDRVLSAYLYLKKGGMAETDRTWAAEHLPKYKDFDQFVREWLTEANVLTQVHFLPQHGFICSDAGEIKMDFIGRMETIRDDFAIVARRLGKDPVLPVLNKVRDEHYAPYYTPAAREIVARVYEKDIRIFKYAFEERAQQQTG